MRGEDDAGGEAVGAVVCASPAAAGAGVGADPVGEEVEFLALPVGVEVRATVDHLLDIVIGGVRPGDLE